MKTVNLKAAVKSRPLKKASRKAKLIQQSGSAPYIVYGSEIRVMLVTPSAGGGWILPKGNIAKRLDTLTSAAKEALEEAGVVGECENNVLGTIHIAKTPDDVASIRIFPLEIKRILPSWQEEGMRSRRLFRIDRAIRIMNTEESAEVLRNLRTLILPHGGGAWELKSNGNSC